MPVIIPLSVALPLLFAFVIVLIARRCDGLAVALATLCSTVLLLMSLAAVYLVWMFQRTMHGEDSGAGAGMGDLNRREVATLVPQRGQDRCGQGRAPRVDKVGAVVQLLDNARRHGEAILAPDHHAQGHVAPADLEVGLRHP